jgi:hypothetical protein
MTKRSAMVLAIGIAVALMATAFALSATSRPNASAKTHEGRHAKQVKPRVRTIMRTVKVHRTKEVPVYVYDSAASDPNSDLEGHDSSGRSEDGHESDEHEREDEHKGDDDHEGEDPLSGEKDPHSGEEHGGHDSSPDDD